MTVGPRRYRSHLEGGGVGGSPGKSFLSSGGSVIIKLKSGKSAVGSAWLSDDRGGQEVETPPWTHLGLGLL